MLKSVFIVLIVLLFSLPTFAQESVSVTLNVNNQQDGEPIENATAQLLRDGELMAEALTNADGTAVLTWSSVDVPHGQELPTGFAITGLYPNPVQASATVEVANRHERSVSVGIYDVLGRRVASRTIALSEGISRIPLQTGLAYGVYFVRFSGSGVDHTRAFLSVGQTGSVQVGAPQWAGSYEDYSRSSQTTTPLNSGQWEVKVEKVGYLPWQQAIDPDEVVELDVELEAITTTVFVESSDINAIPAGYTAHLVVGADTLSATNGIFENILVGQEVKAFFTNQGEYRSFIRTVMVEQDNKEQAGGSQTGFYIRPTDFNLYNRHYEKIGELQHEGILLETIGGLRNAIKTLYVDLHPGVGAWNGEQDIIPLDKNVFPAFTQSSNFKGPQTAIIPNTFHAIATGESHHLTEHVKDLILANLAEHTLVYMGFNARYAPEIVTPDSISFDALNNQYKNHVIIAPYGNFPPGGAGSIAIYGKKANGGEYNHIYNALVRIRSPPAGISDFNLKRAINQENTAWAIMTRVPMNPSGIPALSTAQQSILHNSTTLSEPSPYDIKIMRFIWQSTYSGSVANTIESPWGAE